MNAAMIRNTCKMWYIWRGTDLLFSTEFATDTGYCAATRQFRWGREGCFCAKEYDPGHDARQPVAASIVSFAVPVLLSQVFQQLYNTDGGYADRRPFLGDGALAAVRSSRPLIFLLISFFVGVTMGAKRHHFALFRRWRPRPCSRAIHTNILVSMCSGILLTVCGVAFLRRSCAGWERPEVLSESHLLFPFTILQACWRRTLQRLQGIMNALVTAAVRSTT